MAQEVKPEKRAGPAWSSAVPSELVTAGSQWANGKGKGAREVSRTVQERSEGRRANRAQGQESQLECSVWALP